MRRHRVWRFIEYRKHTVGLVGSPSSRVRIAQRGAGEALGTLAEAGTLATQEVAFDAASAEFANAGLYHLSAIESEVAERAGQEALEASAKGVARVAGASGVGGFEAGRFLTDHERPGWYKTLRATPFLGLGIKLGEFVNGCVLAPLGLY